MNLDQRELLEAWLADKAKVEGWEGEYKGLL